MLTTEISRLCKHHLVMYHHKSRHQTTHKGNSNRKKMQQKNKMYKNVKT